LVTFSFNSIYATDYFFSNSGEDSNNGLSPAYPMKSIAKLNSLMVNLKPGDAVLFERGSIFYGQININASGNSNGAITFSSYGNGRNPVISGSVPVTGWSQYKENMFTSDISGNVKNVFVNGEQMTLARYPNTGFLSIDKSLPDPKKGFFDKNLSQPAGYWNGSIARIRTINWAYEYSDIIDFKNSSVVLKNPTLFPILSGWGYYLDNNLNELDTLNEWYFEKNDNDIGKVYFYPPFGESINNLNIQASIYDYGFFSDTQVANIIIRDLDILNQSESGIFFPRKISDLKIENCTFKGQVKTGLSNVNKSDNLKITNCRFNNINGKALSLNSVSNSTVSKNIFLNSGMIPGYGTTGDVYVLSAMYVFGDNNIISENYINGVGHDAINCLGAGNLVEKNVIKNCLQLLNDGGGIKCYGKYTNNSVWCNNFIYNVRGNIENTTEKEIKALGIYLDEFTNNMTILNNTVSGSKFSGIGIHDANNNLVINNILYNNNAGINLYMNKNSMDNKFFGNVIKSNNNNQYSVDIKYLGGELLPGIFDSNYYFNPGNQRSFGITYRNLFKDYSFQDWKLFVKSEEQSKIYIGPEFTYSKLYANMSDEIISINLGSQFDFKNKNLNEVNGTVELLPWTSEVLFTDVDLSNMPEITIAGGPIYFDDNQSENSISLEWYVISGINISEPVYVNAPEGYEISLFNDHDFSNKIILSSETGVVENIIFVRYNPISTGIAKGSILNISGDIELKLNVEIKMKTGLE